MLRNVNFLKSNSSKVEISFFNSRIKLIALCEYVKDLLLEESNVQPIAAPVAVCGGIQYYAEEFYFRLFYSNY